MAAMVIGVVTVLTATGAVKSPLHYFPASNKIANKGVVAFHLKSEQQVRIKLIGILLIAPRIIFANFSAYQCSQ
jgi:hypothetical protein